MSMNILRATKLKYGAIHSAEPKQMCLWSICQRDPKGLIGAGKKKRGMKPWKIFS